MKNLKKLAGIVLSLIFVFTVVACSPVTTRTFEGIVQGFNIRTTYTAKGDEITHQKTVQTFKFSDIGAKTEEQKKAVMESVKKTTDKNSALKGVKDTVTVEGENLIETIEIDFTQADMKELVDNHLIVLEGTEIPKKLSLKKTADNIIKQGGKEVK